MSQTTASQINMITQQIKAATAQFKTLRMMILEGLEKIDKVKPKLDLDIDHSYCESDEED